LNCALLLSTRVQKRVMVMVMVMVEAGARKESSFGVALGVLLRGLLSTAPLYMK
jgi:hypothetical protein